MSKTKLFWIATAITIGWIIFMRPYTPKNIVQFEFAKTVENATTIITEWGVNGVELAKTSIYLDLVFIILYCSSIMLGCRVSSQFSKKEFLIKIGIFFSFLIWIAGVCDVIENVAMLKTLTEINQLPISVSFYFAAIKFSIVLITLAFVIASSLTGLFNRLTT